MANGVALLYSHERKGKLSIRHPNVFRHYLVLNGPEDTHIRFDGKIPFPFTVKDEKRNFRQLFADTYKKLYGKEEPAQ
ncbi:MAG: hypothetical protein WCT52_05790 [Candidatus Micrarchaeia archaeon]